MKVNQRLHYWEDLSLEDFKGEVWKDIPIAAYKGIYQASNFGRIKSLERTCITKAGKLRSVSERILRQSKRQKNKYKSNPVATIGLGTNNIKKGQVGTMGIIALTFGMKKNSDEYFIHKDGNLLNNSIENIIVGKKSLIEKIKYAIHESNRTK